MSNLAPEQLFATQKAAVDMLFGLTFKAFEEFQKLVELNLRVVKSTLAENQEVVGKALSAKDPQGFFALQTPLTGEKLQSYWRQVSEIATSTQGEFTAAAEGNFKKSQHDVQMFVESLAKNAPAGSEALVSAWKSAIGTASETASSAYDAAKKATQQVVEIAESNVSAASSASAALAKNAVARTTATTEKK
jgi:phasin family protein